MPPAERKTSLGGELWGVGRRGALPQAVSVSFPALAVGVQQQGCFYLGPQERKGKCPGCSGDKWRRV